MPAPIGSVWGAGTWGDGVWGEGTWGEAETPVTPPVVVPPPEPKLFLRHRGDARFIRRSN